MNVNRKYWLWLTRIDGIGHKKIRMLLDFGVTPKTLFHMGGKELGRLFENRLFSNRDVRAFYDSRDMTKLIGYERRLKALGIGYVTIEDDDYPHSLMGLFDPPYVLYYRGRLPEHQLSIGMVGSRKCTAYGRKVAECFGEELGAAGINVVSGLAKGIDTYSHIGAIRSGGFTTAVLGCGINVCYPKENLNLMKEIVHNGCIISEYGLDVAPKAGLFPMRNRIISGLSHGVLLVEARKKSGSLITVDCALEAGKDVFAVPGDVLGGSNEGSNNVIRMGGKPVFSVEDIMEEYRMKVVTRSPCGVMEEAVEPMNLFGMDEDERKVFGLLGQMPIFLDELSSMTTMDVSRLQFVLTKLEIKDMVVQLPGKHFVRK